jgi:hypothetical protein
MHLRSLARVLSLAAILTGALPASGAEFEPPLVRRTHAVMPVKTHIFSPCRSVWSCDRYGCDWKYVCARRCPDRYSCFSLYGAYGPYGGGAYWGRYTWAGWGPYR